MPAVSVLEKPRSILRPCHPMKARPNKALQLIAHSLRPRTSDELRRS